MLKLEALATIAVSFGYMLLGWDFAAMSGVDLYIKKEFSYDEGIMLATPILGAIIITIFSGSFSDGHGRLPMLTLSSLLYSVGGLFMLWSPNIYVLLLARLITGFGTGLAFSFVPLYIAEISQPEMRGALNTVPQFMFFGGMLCSYCMILLMELLPPPSWRFIAGTILIPSISSIALTIFYLPESPKWLANDGKIEEAKVVLQRLRGTNDVSGELSLIVEGLNRLDYTAIQEYTVGSANDIPGYQHSEIENVHVERIPTPMPHQVVRSSQHSTLSWISDPLVSLLGSVQDASDTASLRSSLFDIGSFRFAEHEPIYEQHDQENVHPNGGFYHAQEDGSLSDGLHTALLAGVVNTEVNNTSVPSTSYGSNLSTRRHDMPGTTQDFVASASHEIEEGRNIYSRSWTGYRLGQGTAQQSQRNTTGSRFKVLLEPGVRHALAFGMMIQVIRQFSGIAGVIRYTPQILEQASIVAIFSDIKMSPHSISIFVSVVITFLMLLCTAVTMQLLDTKGRRALLLATIPCLTVSLLFLSNIVDMGPMAHTIILLVSLVTCLCSYSMGLGPIPNILCSEIFPTNVSATCVSVCSLSFWFGSLLCSYLFPVMLSTIGLAGTLRIDLFVCCIALLFVVFRVPETKGLPTEIIVEFFKVSRKDMHNM